MTAVSTASVVNQELFLETNEETTSVHSVAEIKEIVLSYAFCTMKVSVMRTRTCKFA